MSTIYRRHRTFWGWAISNRLTDLAWRVAREMGLPRRCREWSDDQREEVWREMLKRTVPIGASSPGGAARHEPESVPRPTNTSTT